MSFNIINSFDAYLLSRENYKKNTHNPSDLTSCIRQLYYKWNGFEKSNPPTAGNIIKMRFGNLAEDLIRDWLYYEVEQGNIKGFDQQVEVWSKEKDLEIQLHGYQDFVVERNDGSLVGVECKSSFGRGIAEIQRTNKPKHDHVVQCYAYMRYGEPKEYWLFYIGRDNGYRTCFYLTYDNGRLFIDGDEYTEQGQPIDWGYYISRMQLSEETRGKKIPPSREFKAAIKDGEVKAKFQRNNVEYKSMFQCIYCDWKDHCYKPLIEASKSGKMFYGEEVVE